MFTYLLHVQGHFNALDIYADTLLSFLESGMGGAAIAMPASIGVATNDVERIMEMVRIPTHSTQPPIYFSV